MATEEHKHLAKIIKECHESLRQLSKQHGPQQAWVEHLKDEKRLQHYAAAMHRLASIWEDNAMKDELLARSRVGWTIDYCTAYFYTAGIYMEKRKRELRLLDSWSELDATQCSYLDPLPNSVRVLDIGSCFNPFAAVPHFTVTAIDLCPATPDVLRGDFLRIPLLDEMSDENSTSCVEHGEVLGLRRNSFECVIFSLLLEYIPSAAQRMECCRKAYELLRPEGVLVIITPDSQHVGKNAALMKNWRYTLGTLGYLRIRFEKLPHITCMAFRKSINPFIAQRWAQAHRKEYMSETIEIPQDEK